MKQFPYKILIVLFLEAIAKLAAIWGGQLREQYTGRC
jgi:hypothetical protein